MKRQLSLLLAAVLILSALMLSSCQNTAETEPAAATSDEAAVTEPTAAAPTAPPETAEPTQEATKYVSDGVRSDPYDTDDATGFVSLSEVIPNVKLDIRYYSDYNFVGERINGYEEPLALLSKEAAQALSDTADDLAEQGYGIKIYDAYRPQSAVDHFISWASDWDDTRMKEDFYPDLDKSVLFDYGYIAYRSGHSRGCTVDITLYDLESGEDLDMGGPFDYFSSLSHPDYTGITDEQYDNRMILREAMTDNGFRACPTEWWDFTLIDEPYPATYFNFPVSSDSLNNH